MHSLGTGGNRGELSINFNFLSFLWKGTASGIQQHYLTAQARALFGVYGALDMNHLRLESNRIDVYMV